MHLSDRNSFIDVSFVHSFVFSFVWDYKLIELIISIYFYSAICIADRNRFYF